MSNVIRDGIAHRKGNSLSPEPCVLIPLQVQSKSKVTFRTERAAHGLDLVR